MEFGIRGKYALVTGGSRGIGRSVALLLAGEGCHVAICARGQSDIDSTLAEIKKLNVEAIGFATDLTKPDNPRDVLEKIGNLWGALHILVNNVGGGGRWGQPTVEDNSDEVWLEVYNKNTMAAVRFTREVLPWMRNQKWGRIVTVTSIYGKEGGGRPWFNMAKAAQTSLMKCLALDRDITRCNITCNSVAPGPIMIPGTGWENEQKNDPVAFERMMKDQLTLGRLGTPDEVATVVVFLCSERASLVNGAAIVVDGGESRSF